MAEAVSDTSPIQYLHQLEPNIRHAVLGNAGTIITFRLGPEDATFIAREFEPYFDHLDLMIVHSPQPWQEFRGEDRYFEGNREAWRALEEAYEAGKLRAIGVSNFEREDIDNILGSCTVKPMVNQILVHIANTPHELIGYSQEKGLLVEAYSPIAHGELLQSERLAGELAIGPIDG